MIHLRLDFVPLIFLQRSDINFVIKMADIADDGLIFHLRHVVVRNHVIIAGRGDKNVGMFSRIIHGHHAITFHRRLQRANRVNFRYPHLRGKRAQRLRRAFAHIAIACHHRYFTCHHHVGRALNRID